MSATDKIIQTAVNEIGYLEKADGHDLYDKTANAGGRNYTKYWADIKPSYQGQPWCAIFVTWCFTQAFGKDKARELLGHYPYVYCPTLANLFARHANPKRGDIVVFYRNKEFVHTGIVTGVRGDYFETVEGNTSGGSTIIANGGGVCKKSYYNSNLPGTKFIRPNYAAVESEDLSMSQYEELNQKIARLTDTVDRIAEEAAPVVHPMIWNYIDENMPEWARPTIQKLVDKGILKGDENGLNLTEELMRLLVINDRAGLYGE